MDGWMALRPLPSQMTSLAPMQEMRALSVSLYMTKEPTKAESMAVQIPRSIFGPTAPDATFTTWCTDDIIQIEKAVMFASPTALFISSEPPNAAK